MTCLPHCGHWIDGVKPPWAAVIAIVAGFTGIQIHFASTVKGFYGNDAHDSYIKKIRQT